MRIGRHTIFGGVVVMIAGGRMALWLFLPLLSFSYDCGFSTSNLKQPSIKKFSTSRVARHKYCCLHTSPNVPRSSPSPAISVVVPTYNRADLLFHCLRALDCQQLPLGFEVVVVDDSSTDGTPQLVEQWIHAGHLRHVRLLCLSPNVGPGRARNAGVIVSLGSLLVFVDSDVIVKPGFLLAHWKRHEQNSVGGCLSVGPVYWLDDISQQTSHRFRWWTDASRAFFCTSNAAVEKQLFVQSGMFDADFTKYGWEDLELGERLR